MICLCVFTRQLVSGTALQVDKPFCPLCGLLNCYWRGHGPEKQVSVPRHAIDAHLVF
jgi:hypothetical protein